MGAVPTRAQAVLLGLDIGTTGAKALLVTDAGEVLGSASKEYPLDTPRPGWAEQNPGHWWEAAIASIRAVLDRTGVPGSTVTAIGLTGQMHGLVALDVGGEVLRPAILWNDQRTEAECQWITERIGPARIMDLLSNPVLTGFTAPKIVWLRRHEPDAYRRVEHLLLPKDYVRYRLTGEFATDVADASGTALFDVRGRAWSQTVLDALEIPRRWLPRVEESPVITGEVSREGAAATGLRLGTSVVAGAGDQAAQAVGSGIVRPGVASVTIGTSGVVFAHLNAVQVDPQGRTHTFCHAVPGCWHIMGVMLSAGGSLRWLRDQVAHRSWFDGRDDPYDRMATQAAGVAPGAEGLLFLPYLTGERTPHADPRARGAFVGLTLRHGPAHLTRAVMEGVAMGLRDSVEIFRALGVPVQQVRFSGGGARSAVWRQIVADVLGAELGAAVPAEGAAYGAALLAAVGCGAAGSVEEACERAVTVRDHVAPVAEHADRYERLYQIYRGLYGVMRPTMHALADLT
ncbi:MAG TPA: xylulokinase [bacterium]|nr:xylulokinase [bacterium]